MSEHDPSNGSEIYHIIIPNVGDYNARLTPNSQLLLVWDQYSTVYVYSISNYSLLHTFNQTYSATPGLTNSLSFTDNSSLVLVERDALPIFVLNLTDYTVAGEHDFSSTLAGTTILAADYIRGSTLFVLTTPGALYVFDANYSTLTLL